MAIVQTWLEDNYAEKADVTRIDSKGEELEGALELKDFPELEVVELSDGKEITKLTIVNCPKLYCLKLSNNKISSLIINDLSRCLDKLQRLELSMNQMTSLDVTKFPNLFILTCIDNPIVGQRVNGVVTSDLVHYAGGIGSDKPNFFSVGLDYKEKLKKIAKNLGVKDSDLRDKKTSDIEKVVDTTSDKVKDYEEVKREADKGKEIIDAITKAAKDYFGDEEGEDTWKKDLGIFNRLKFIENKYKEQKAQTEVPPK